MDALPLSFSLSPLTSPCLSSLAPQYDARGYWYFMDRVGDTFRWKGENVATAEVEIGVRSFPGGVSEVTAYGAEVPGADGRGCMVAMVRCPPPARGLCEERLRSMSQFSCTSPPHVSLSSLQSFDESTFDFAAFAAHVRKSLPSYAVPLFIRRLPHFALTSTLKHQKVDLRAAGADPVRVAADTRRAAQSPEALAAAAASSAAASSSSSGAAPPVNPDACVWVISDDWKTYEPLTPQRWKRVQQASLPKAKL